MTGHPYKDVPGYQLHRIGVAGRHPAFFDPVTATKFTLNRGQTIATLGSCFAQHLSKWLLENGHSFLALEPVNTESGGLFSANFGNIYTVAQAQQLFTYAFGYQQPGSEAWETPAGKFVDPLRPNATMPGYDTPAAMLAARQSHYAAVRRMYETAEVIVFTLGLTEAWRRKSDGAILPTAPGVVAGSYSPVDYEFVNFGFADVCAQLTAFLQSATTINPKLKIILTVSPVPLAATYVDRHVAVSTVVSKSILRAAVDAVIPAWNNVEYFPSFEIFYTPGVSRPYFEDDFRHVTRAGVQHAMRIFERHFLGDTRQDTQPTAAIDATALFNANYDVVCDEEKIDQT